MKSRKVFKWICTTMQMALLIFAGCIYYLSNEKMGVMRSLTYRNEIYVKLALENKILYGLLVMLILFSMFAIKNYKKSNKYKYYLFFIGINLATILFAIYFNGGTVLSYYVVLMAFSILLAIQLIKIQYL